MARLYIVNPDGPGLYTWDFHSPEWFQRSLASYPQNKNGWLAWAGFLGGLEIMMRRRLAIDRSWDPVQYEPSDPEDCK